ncbi:uncharacterized protein C7D4.12c isoform X2 [Physcomitrium patens]|uniref:uncharacterized protein C7D4.12c isoform X2 n=2 Tax=Physcomitrium patens TaxID=3218 RepID=UPI003CCDA876
MIVKLQACCMGQKHQCGRKEIHMLTVASDLDVGKLGHVDELTNQVGRSGTTFAFSYWRLKKIINSPPVFDKWCRLFGYAVSAATSAPLFFDGGPWDAFFCLIFGTAVGILDMIASINPMFATIMGFSSACLVAFLSKCLISNLKGLGLCYIALTLGSLTQLLPSINPIHFILILFKVTLHLQLPCMTSLKLVSFSCTNKFVVSFGFGPGMYFTLK